MDEQEKMKDEIERKKFNDEMRGLLPWLKRLGMVVGLVAIVFLGNVIFNAVHFFSADVSIDENGDSSTDTMANGDSADCNVYGINIHGSMETYIPANASMGDYDDAVASEDIILNVDQAEAEDSIKAILAEVDSNGGLPVAGEEASNALKNASKPTVAFIRQTGASAAYWAASGADYIFASANSDIGSIGVTISYLTNLGQNIKDGQEFVGLTAGKYKDMGNPNKPVTPEEKALFIRDLEITKQNFINAVATNRNLSVEAVTKIADGSSMLGVQAKEAGLIDEIGGIAEVKSYLKNKIGEDPVICWH